MTGTGTGTLARWNPRTPRSSRPPRTNASSSELEHRSGPLRREISERIERARELGDLKENADYDAAKNEQGLNEARVRQLEAMLRDVEIVEGGGGDIVEAGVIVEVRVAGDDETQTYLIGSIEERHDRYDVLSTSAPMGQAILGHRAGDDGELRDAAGPGARRRDRQHPTRRLAARRGGRAGLGRGHRHELRTGSRPSGHDRACSPPGP